MSAEPLGVVGWCVARARVVLSLLFCAVAMVPFLPWMVLAPSRGQQVRRASQYAKLISHVALWLYGIKVVGLHRKDLEPHFPAIFIANHSSFLDAFLALMLHPYGVVGVAKKEIVRIPFFGQMYALSGHVQIDRQNHERAVDAMRAAGREVNDNGLGVWMFPEGTLPREAEMLPFKKGFVHLAAATGLPVVPILFHNARDLWPTRTLDVRPGIAHVEMMAPLDTTAWRAEDAREISERVRAMMDERLKAGPPA